MIESIEDLRVRALQSVERHTHARRKYRHDQTETGTLVLPTDTIRELLKRADPSTLPSHWNTSGNQMRELLGESPEPTPEVRCSECGTKQESRPISGADKVRLPAQFVVDLCNAQRKPTETVQLSTISFSSLDAMQKLMKKTTKAIAKAGVMFTDHMDHFPRPKVNIGVPPALKDVPEFKRAMTKIDLVSCLAGVQDCTKVKHTGDLVRVEFDSSYIREFEGFLEGVGITSLERIQIEFDVGMAMLGRRQISMMVDFRYNELLESKVKHMTRSKLPSHVAIRRGRDWCLYGGPISKQYQVDKNCCADGLIRMELLFNEVEMGPYSFPPWFPTRTQRYRRPGIQ